MTSFRLLKKDIIMGIFQKWYRYIVVVLIAFFSSKEIYESIHMMREMNLLFADETIVDVYLLATKSMDVYRFNPQTIFVIPIYWFAFQMSIHYIVAYYPQKDFSGYGRNVLLAAKSRKKWWYCKCIWCIISVFFYYVLFIGTIVVVNQLERGVNKLSFTEEVLAIFSRDSVRYLTLGDFIWISLLIPFVVTVSLCMLQMLLSFILSPVLSFALMCGVYVLSAYYTSCWLPGNYTMWLRSSYITIDGINFDNGLVIGVYVIISCLFFGGQYFKSIDIL